MARAPRVSVGPKGQMVFAGRRKPRAKRPPRQRAVSNAVRAAMTAFKLHGKNPALREQNLEFLQECDRFLKKPAAERTPGEAVKILEGLKQMKKRIKEKGQIKMEFR